MHVVYEAKGGWVRSEWSCIISHLDCLEIRICYPLDPSIGKDNPFVGFIVGIAEWTKAVEEGCELETDGSPVFGVGKVRHEGS